jgi:hypothetical protein
MHDMHHGPGADAGLLKAPRSQYMNGSLQAVPLRWLYRWRSSTLNGAITALTEAWWLYEVTLYFCIAGEFQGLLGNRESSGMTWHKLRMTMSELESWSLSGQHKDKGNSTRTGLVIRHAAFRAEAQTVARSFTLHVDAF